MLIIVILLKHPICIYLKIYNNPHQVTTAFSLYCRRFSCKNSIYKNGLLYTSFLQKTANRQKRVCLAGTPHRKYFTYSVWCTIKNSCFSFKKGIFLVVLEAAQQPPVLSLTCTGCWRYKYRLFEV